MDYNFVKSFNGVVKMFGFSNIIKPGLDFTGKVEKFHRDDNEMFSRRRLFAGNDDADDEIISKVQTVHYDLNSREIVSVYTNLECDEISEFCFVNKDERLMDVWDDLIVKEE